MSEGTFAADIIRRSADLFATRVSETVYGYEHVTKLLLGSFFLGGHVLLEGPPGIAKTLLSKTFANVLGLEFRRIQFTPDLMPSDITGVNIFEPKSGTFRFVPGPLFADIILADEINRTPPKTQSALLEAMEERQMTIDGERRELSHNLFVIATQNPVEHEGTFPLPEAQLDRFFMKIPLSYPDRTFEDKMIQTLSSNQAFSASSRVKTNGTAQSILSAQEILNCRKLIRDVLLSSAMSDYILKIACATREHPSLLLGASPRAALHLALATKLHAALSGRNYTIPDDVKAMAHFVLQHRLIMQPAMYDSSEGALEVVRTILNRVAPPSNLASEQGSSSL